MNERRQRDIPLPSYQDSSLLWHYHVLCRHCTPYGLTDQYVKPTRRAAFELREELNESILFPVHTYVVIGCALGECQPD